MLRNGIIAVGEYYHVYNRGVDKRQITLCEADSNRFLECLVEFNTSESVGSLRDLPLPRNPITGEPLVEIVAYCLNPNHFHFLLKPLRDDGIGKFMQKLSGGYSRYFNKKYKRKGALFQGAFKVKHVSDNSYLNHVSAYINLNDKVHNISGPSHKLVRSSWNEYLIGGDLCKKEIILDQFNNTESYEEFAGENLELMLEKRPEYKELEAILVED